MTSRLRSPADSTLLFIPPARPQLTVAMRRRFFRLMPLIRV